MGERATKINKPGVYFDVAAADYFADCCPSPSLTQSIAKILIDQSPAHAKLAHPRLNPDYRIRADNEPYDKAKAIGNAAHKLVLGRGKEVCIIEADNFMAKKPKDGEAMTASDTRKQAIKDGYEPILAKHHFAASQLMRATFEQMDANDFPGAFLVGGESEVVIAWEEDGLWFRSMIDWMAGGRLIFDLKTGGMSAAPHAIPSRMVDAGWHIQAAMHERGLDILDPENAGRRHHYYIAVENEPPYALSVNEITEGPMTMGRKQLQYAIDLWRRCLENDHWPAYPLGVNQPQFPAYRENQWLEREIAAAALDRMPER